MNKIYFFLSITFLYLSACDGTSSPPVPTGQYFQQSQSDNSVILLCECENNKHHVMGQGENQQMAKKSAQLKCQLFSSDYSIKNCKNMQ